MTQHGPFLWAPALGHLGHGVCRHPQGSQKTLHGILRPLVSGTQLLFQSNHSGPEIALGKQKTRPDQGHKSLLVGSSTGSPWASTWQTSPRSLQGSPHSLRITEKIAPCSLKETPLPGIVPCPGSLTTGSQDKKSLITRVFRGLRGT